MTEINWQSISTNQIKQLNDLQAIFIPAPREISDARLLQLVKTYLPKANIILGVANEQYVRGFDGQSQFKTLDITSEHKIISKVNNSNSTHKITLLKYDQAEIENIFKTVDISRVILVNGSWLYSFHLRPECAVLKERGISYKFVSPFTDEKEAIEFANQFVPSFAENSSLLSEHEMLGVVQLAATNSFDTSFQVGAVFGKKVGTKYELVESTCNTVVPYLTYAWHNGSSREKFKSFPGDLSHYDAVHAETMLILQALRNGYETGGLTIFINLLPCRHCARMLCELDFNELVYERNHSEGYAVGLLEKAGKKVRQINREGKK